MPDEEVVAPAGEKYLTKEEFLEAQTNLVGTLREMMAYRAPEVRQEAAPEPDLPEVTDDDDVPTAMRKTEARLTRAFNKRVQELENVGLTTMGAISDRVLEGKLEYYPDYKDEIDAYRMRLPAAQRAHPDAIKMAHDFVVSQHLGEIVQKKVDAAVRASVRDDSPTSPNPRRGGRDYKVEGVPTPAELGLSEQQCRAVEARGGWDDWAAKMSSGRFKTYKEYAAARVKHASNFSSFA